MRLEANHSKCHQEIKVLKVTKLPKREKVGRLRRDEREREREREKEKSHKRFPRSTRLNCSFLSQGKSKLDSMTASEAKLTLFVKHFMQIQKLNRK